MRRLLVGPLVLWVILVSGCSSNSDRIIKQFDEALEGRRYGSDANTIIENILTHRVEGYPTIVNPHVRELLAKPLLTINANEFSFLSGTANNNNKVSTNWEAPEDLPRGLREFLSQYIYRLLKIRQLVLDSGTISCCEFENLLKEITSAGHFYPELKKLLALLDQNNLEKAIAHFVSFNEWSIKEINRLDLSRLLVIAPTSFNSPIGEISIYGVQDNSHVTGPGLIFDLGGNDEYRRSVTNSGEISVIIDISGDDSYNGLDTSLGGVTVLTDLRGDDRYFSPGSGLGASIGGLSWLQDQAGNDHYSVERFGLGAAIAGFGTVIDEGGNDQYHVKSLGQGFGGPSGYGELQDFGGDDQYFADDGVQDRFERGSGRLSYAQGVGAGFASKFSGGIGILRDKLGNDSYFAEMFAQGQGIFFGLGILEDSEGNDTYTLTRFGQGQGSSAGVGLLTDLDGNDDYRLDVGWGQGMGLDTGIGVLVDFDGDDRYSSVDLAQGSSIGNGFGLLGDGDGEDIYYLAKPGLGWGRGRAARGLPGLPFLVDVGGQAHYILSGELILDVGIGGAGGPLAGVELAIPSGKGFECPDSDAFLAPPSHDPLFDRLVRSAPKFGLNKDALQEFVGLYKLMPAILPNLLRQITVADMHVGGNLGTLVRCYLKDADKNEKDQIRDLLVDNLRSEHPLTAIIIGLLRFVPPSSEITLELGNRLKDHDNCGVRTGAILLLRHLNEFTEEAKNLARQALKDSCWQVQSAALSFLAAIEENRKATVSREIYNELPSPLLLRAVIEEGDNLTED